MTQGARRFARRARGWRHTVCTWWAAPPSAAASPAKVNRSVQHNNNQSVVTKRRIARTRVDLRACRRFCWSCSRRAADSCRSPARPRSPAARKARFDAPSPSGGWAIGPKTRFTMPSTASCLRRSSSDIRFAPAGRSRSLAPIPDHLRCAAGAGTTARMPLAADASSTAAQGGRAFTPKLAFMLWFYFAVCTCYKEGCNFNLEKAYWRIWKTREREVFINK